jgi:hypothetical protein
VDGDILMISGSAGFDGAWEIAEGGGSGAGAVTALICGDVVVIASELFDLPAGALIALSA